MPSEYENYSLKLLSIPYIHIYIPNKTGTKVRSAPVLCPSGDKNTTYEMFMCLIGHPAFKCNFDKI